LPPHLPVKMGVSRIFRFYVVNPVSTQTTAGWTPFREGAIASPACRAWNPLPSVPFEPQSTLQSRTGSQFSAFIGRIDVAKIKIPAARVKQGGLVLYATALKVRDLVSK